MSEGARLAEVRAISAAAVQAAGYNAAQRWTNILTYLHKAIDEAAGRGAYSYDLRWFQPACLKEDDYIKNADMKRIIEHLHTLGFKLEQDNWFVSWKGTK